MEATSGKVLCDGQPIQRGLTACKQRMGCVPKEPHLSLRNALEKKAIRACIRT